jgi:hypothetical protein
MSKLPYKYYYMVIDEVLVGFCCSISSFCLGWRSLIQESGHIAKTARILEHIDDEQPRRRVLIGLNKGPLLHIKDYAIVSTRPSKGDTLYPARYTLQKVEAPNCFIGSRLQNRVRRVIFSGYLLLRASFSSLLRISPIFCLRHPNIQVRR